MFFWMKLVNGVSDGASGRASGSSDGVIGKTKQSHRFEPIGFCRTVAVPSDVEMRGALWNLESSEDFMVFVKPYLAGG
jgi:hypothetical protein